MLSSFGLPFTSLVKGEFGCTILLMRLSFFMGGQSVGKDVPFVQGAHKV